MTTPTAIIVGAGTAGLGAHVSLRRAGFEILHLERKPSVQERGGNLAIWPNGGRVLADYGAGELLDGVGFPPAGFSTFDARGELVSRAEYGPIADRMGLPMYMVPRAHFQAMLFDFVGRDRIQLGVACASVTQDDEGVTATLDDGRVVRADILVAADGVRSPIRRHVAGDVPLRHVGITIWTGWMVDDGFLASVSPRPDSMVEFWGPGRRMVFMPSGRGYAGFTFLVRTRENVSVPDPHGWLSEMFADFPPAAGKILDRLQSEMIIEWPVYDLPPLPRWHSGRVVLIGDAAHAASPTLGQGAGMALEDGYVLGQCLARTELSMEARLTDFVSRRKTRTETLSAESRSRSQATTEDDPVRLAAIQAAVRKGDPWALLNGMTAIVAGGPIS
jgi:2-polyprenyl-6-methoxyphenol hydroxylase-like FAD-dependent oxidoreductase